MKRKLVLMCGLPGSGKTTLARRLADEIPAVRLCTDEWQAALQVELTEGDSDSEAFHDLLEAQLWLHAKDLLRHGQSIIFEKGLWLRRERDDKRREARELGVDIELHYFDVPLDELVRRLEKRNSRGDPNAFRISRAEIEEYYKLFEPPDETELALFPVSIVHRAGRGRRAARGRFHTSLPFQPDVLNRVICRPRWAAANGLHPAIGHIEPQRQRSRSLPVIVVTSGFCPLVRAEARITPTLSRLPNLWLPRPHAPAAAGFPVAEDLQRVVSLNPDAEHADGEQVLGGELVGDVFPVSASSDSLEVGAGVDRAARRVSGQVSLH
jgi:predicted kinase